MKLKWIEIDPENLPQGEVLARDAEHCGIIGKLYRQKSGAVSCTNEYQELSRCTHYADLGLPMLPMPNEAFAIACALAAKYEESLEAKMAYLNGFIHCLSWLKSKIQ